MSSQQQDAASASGEHGQFTWVRVLIVIVAAVAAFLIGRAFGYHDVWQRDAIIQGLQANGQKLEATLAARTADLTSLRAQYADIEAKLEAIVPTKDTYSVDPNHSVLVADGRLSIGLIGAPTNEGVSLNVNGKQQTVAAGDIVRVVLEPATTCQVRIEAFDMFKALVTATCAAKPQ
jgi:hypothetical protein